MNEPKLSPCRDCGGECVVEHITVTGFDFYSTHHPNLPDGKSPACPFGVQAATKEQAIANHERLAGVCEWRRTFIGQTPYLSNGCLGRGVQLSRFCPDCGKKVEVKE